jgi:membrane dipeptidase
MQQQQRQDYETVNRLLKITKEQEEHALVLHQKSIVISSLDSLMRKNLSNRSFVQGYFQKWKTGGITAQNVSVGKAKNPGFRSTVLDVCTWYRILEDFADHATQALSVEDIKRAKQSGKAAVIFGFQYAGPIEDELDFLLAFRKLGLRIMDLCYQRKNLIGDGCGERTNAGLSKYGIEVVEEMNRIGMLIDLTHSGRKTCMEAIEASKYPVIFSHTNVNALCDFNINATDEEIRALAERGGVMGIPPMSQYLRPDGAIEGSTINDYLDHIDYVVKLVGVDHVGLGMDLLEGETPENQAESDRMWPEMFKRPAILEKKHPVGLQSIAEIGNVTKGLVARGYSDQEIQKIIGGNFLRVFEQVWK